MQRLHRYLAEQTPRLWLFYGDSITHGARHTHGHRDYVQLFEERVRHELGRPWDTVVRTAISGNTTEDLLEEFDPRVGRFRPDVVFVMIGMNDSGDKRGVPLERFRQNLHELKHRCDALESVLVFQTTCPLVPQGNPEREARLDDYMQAVRDVAATEAAPLIDHAADWRQRAETHQPWMNNAVHPNQYGHRVFARCLFRALGVDDPKGSATCRLFVP